MSAAALWGFVAASSLLVGAVLGLVRPWSSRLVGAVLAFGGGALIASIAFELFEEGLHDGGPVPVGIGLAVGAVVYLVANKLVERAGDGQPREHRHHLPHHGHGAGGSGEVAQVGQPSVQGRRRAQGGTSLAVGAFLDGIPEQAVLGIGLASGGSVGIALLVAIFVSNLPEAIGSATDMREAGQSKSFILVLWAGVTAVCGLATVAGYLVADVVSAPVQGGIQGFAAGALLVMLVDSLVPEAREKAGESAGLVTVLGFAFAAGLSFLA